ncbi:MAG: FMN-binding glutamate synthase family protein [Bdellovibrionales bacterium]|nr:FMN-binding glutamate synthase family protein [Bdellovibrionales bacterium]
MLFLFHGLSLFIILIIGLLAIIWPPILYTLVLFLPVYAIGVVDSFQKRHAVRRNFPVIGNLRYFFELIRPELQQYFVESNHSGRPIPREIRSVVYQRAKGQLETLPFGTQRDVHAEGHEWVHHSMVPQSLEAKDLRIKIGGPQCTQPYSASILNISAMSYGALSKAAVRALNLGAKEGGFYHNTGEGGISPYHLQGGDLCWQIGTGYFGCRTKEGNFCEKTFAEKAKWESVKLIEIKISQGAKPGKGGLLPGAKVTKEIAEIRCVEEGKDVISPSKHTTFSTPSELLDFIQKLRELSGGKPVGFKFCVGRRSEFFGICKAMVKKQIYPDFITVDGAEGGTGAAPLEFANSVGRPLDEGLAFVVDTLEGFDLKDYIKVIAAGKVFTSFHLLTKLALGADLVYSARGMMLALGCIQALKCNSNHCPVGVATTNPQLVRGLDISDKSMRVMRYHHTTVKAFVDILGAMGYTDTTQLRRSDVFRRLSDGLVKSYEDIYPSIPRGCYLNDVDLPEMPMDLLAAFKSSSVDSFFGKV